MSVINPYSGIDWQNTQRILSVSHQHLSHNQGNSGGIPYPQKVFNDIYATGVRHYAISRYRPSILSYPFDYENNTFPYVRNPFSATDDIQTLKAKYTVQVEIPNDVIGSPNAEHVNPIMNLNGKAYEWTCTHLNAIGSFYETGTVPKANGYKNAGIAMPYSDFIRNALNALQYSDGGGIIVNHAFWTTNELLEKRTEPYQYDVRRFIMDCLDLDDRVLGTDIIEDGKQKAYQLLDKGLIDAILSTGRRCWLFCQGDWDTLRGRNELLIQPPEGITRAELERYCLKAYRDGSFFGRYADSDLTITAVTYDESSRTYTINTANADGIEITIDGVSTEYGGNSVSVVIPQNAVYVRAMAFKNRDDDPDWTYREFDIYKDMVFTNPIMLNPVDHTYNPAYDFESGDDTDPGDGDEDEEIPDQGTKIRYKSWLYG